MRTTQHAKGAEQNAAKRTAAVLALTYVGEAKSAIEAAIATGALTEQEVWWLYDWAQRLTQLRIQLQQRTEDTERTEGCLAKGTKRAQDATTEDSISTEEDTATALPPSHPSRTSRDS